MEYKSHFPGLGSAGIRPKSWKVMEIRTAGVTKFLTICLNEITRHVRYLVEFVNTFAFAITGTLDAK